MTMATMAAVGTEVCVVDRYTGRSTFATVSDVSPKGNIVVLAWPYYRTGYMTLRYAPTTGAYTDAAGNGSKIVSFRTNKD